MKEFEIFRTGTWTSDKGITKNYSEEDLDKIVENYNSEDPAPIVIGHPFTDAPAYGWIDKIKRVKDRLIAIPKQLNQQFVDLVKNGSFKKRSISITPDFKLNHVGFLGAAAPAVSGLKEIQFNAEEELLNFSSDLSLSAVEEKSLKVSIDNSSASDDKPIETQINVSALEGLTSIVNDLKQNFTKLSDDELSKIHSRINELSFAMQVNDFELRLNEKLAYGSLTPAMKNKIMDIVSFLQKQNFSASQFSYEKYISDVKNLLTDFVESIPRIIYYENFAEKPDQSIPKDDEFDQANVDEDSLQIHKKALQYMKAHKDVEYVEAINIVSAQ